MASRIFKLLQVVQDSFNQKMSFPDVNDGCLIEVSKLLSTISVYDNYI